MDTKRYEDRRFRNDGWGDDLEWEDVKPRPRRSAGGSTPRSASGGGSRSGGTSGSAAGSRGVSGAAGVGHGTGGTSGGRSGARTGATSSRGGARASAPGAGRAGGRGSAAPKPSRPKAQRAPRPKKGKGGLGKRLLKLTAIFMVLALIGGMAAAGIVYASVSKTLPDPSKPLKGRDQTTRILDRQGRLLTKLYAEQNRTNVKLEQVPTALRQAVVATEDERFYDHKGVDPIGLTRALVTDIRLGKKAQGGSTITQQFVKQAFMTPERTIKRKVSEALLAYRVEKTYSKDQILEMYLNTIYYGHGAYGIEAASQVYFGKSVSKLNLAECAMLAGVIKSPGRYSPYLDEKAAHGRRATVLGQMLRQEYIGQAEHDEAAAAEFGLAGLKSRVTQAPYFVEYVKTLLIDKYGSEAVFRGGLTVRTTIDMKLQKSAEKSVNSILNRKGDPSAALVTIDPATGDILAMVGGKDYKTQQYNVAVQGHRQPGSAFKPFVLVAALESSVSPEATYESGPIKLSTPSGPDWKVTGAGGGRRGPMRLREATERSVNSVYAKLILDLGADKVAATAKRLGITTPVRPVPAIALGGLETGVTPLEMASSYATLASGGVKRQPHPMLEVRDASGKLLYSVKGARPQRVVSEKVAYLTTDILKGVVKRGTGEAADIGRPSAGKTGTTQAYRDAWYVGYTPHMATAVWVGFPDSAREMDSVHGIKVTGGTFPARIWASFMRDAHAGKKSADFKRPGGLSSGNVCAETGLKATDFCPKTVRGLFFAGKTPGACDVHTTPKEIVVPNLVGMTKEAALAALKKLMLLFKVVERDIAGVDAGIVAEQTPKAGSKGTTETVVTVVVGKGGGSLAGAAPVAAFSYSPAGMQFGKPITFDASASTDDSKIVSYVWEFGDGTKATGKTVKHVYAASGPGGPFDVILWVTDDEGLVASAKKTITIK